MEIQTLVNAIRNKYRFDSSKGSLNVEDLFDLPLTSAKGVSLDEIAISLDRQLRETPTSFVTQRTAVNAALQEKLDIVKYVISTKLAENEARNNANRIAAERARLTELIVRKQESAEAELSVEELKARLDLLG